MTHRIGVVAHYARADQAHQLMESIGAVYLAMDNGTLGAEGNHRRAWTYMAHHNPAEWGVVLEDDATPVDGFADQLADVLAVAPTPVVSLYLGAGRPPQWQDRIRQATTLADQEQTHWLIADRLLYGVGVCIRTDLVPSMLQHTERTREPWDYAVRTWAYQSRHPISFCWPSIVDHRDEPTLIQHPDRQPRLEERKAWRTGTRARWSSKAIQL